MAPGCFGMCVACVYCMLFLHALHRADIITINTLLHLFGAHTQHKSVLVMDIINSYSHAHAHFSLPHG